MLVTGVVTVYLGLCVIGVKLQAPVQHADACMPAGPEEQPRQQYEAGLQVDTTVFHVVLCAG